MNKGIKYFSTVALGALFVLASDEAGEKASELDSIFPHETKDILPLAAKADSAKSGIGAESDSFPNYLEKSGEGKVLEKIAPAKHKSNIWLDGTVDRRGIDLTISKMHIYNSNILDLSIPKQFYEKNSCSGLGNSNCYKSEEIPQTSDSIDFSKAISKNGNGGVKYNSGCDIIGRPQESTLANEHPDKKMVITECLGGVDVQGSDGIKLKFRGGLERDQKAGLGNIKSSICPDKTLSECASIEVGIEIELGH